MDSNLLTNKIISIIVALIVATLVLVPICASAVQTNGGESPTSLADNEDERVFRMSKIDLNDHSKTYTVRPITFSEFNGTNADMYIIGMYDTILGSRAIFPQILDDSNNISSVPDEVTIYYNTSTDMWVSSIYPDNNSDLFMYIGGDTYLFDPEGDYYGHTGIMQSVTEFDTSKYIKGYFEMYYGEEDWVENAYVTYAWNILGLEEEISSYPDSYTSNISLPNISKDNMGVVHIEGAFTYNSSSGTGPHTAKYGTYVAISDSPNTPTPSSGNNSTLYTLIQIIPLFVILGILLSVVTLMTGRSKELELS